MKEEVDKYKAEHSWMLSELNVAQDSIAQLKQQLEECKTAEDTISKTQQELEEQQQQVIQLNEQLNAAQGRETELDAQCKDLTVAKEKLNEDLVAEREQVRIVQESLTEYEQKIQEAKELQGKDMKGTKKMLDE